MAVPLVDCRIGGQTIAFSNKCKKVIAIEIDKNHVDVLKENLKRLGKIES